MKRFTVVVSTVAAVAAMSTAGARADTNVALGATVSVTATDPDPSAGFNNGTSANLQKITNGTILADATGYGSSAATGQAIEWNGNQYVFQISLNGTFTINSVLVDADDNDAYTLQWHDIAANQWDALYIAPIVSQGFGLRTRPNTSNQSQTFSLSTPVTTDAVRISGGQSNDNFTYDGVGGQGGYAVAQVELFGTKAPTAAPEPSSMAVLGAGLAGLIGLRRRRLGS